jgi:hypothetical protein
MKRIHLLNSFAATLLLSGCMGYQLGGSRPEGIEAVTMAAVVNKTGEPAIELQVTHAMRERIQFDGRMKYVNKQENADAVIKIELTGYRLTPVAYRDELRTTPELYRLTITGHADLVSTKDGTVLSSSSTYGESTFKFTSDLTTSKRDAVPVAAQEIAKFMLDDLIERW